MHHSVHFYCDSCIWLGYFLEKSWNYYKLRFRHKLWLIGDTTSFRAILSLIINSRYVYGRPDLTQLIRDMIASTLISIDQISHLFTMNCKLFFTSVPITFVVKSVWIWNEILRSGFLSSVTKLALEERDHPVKALASIIFPTKLYACVREFCQHRAVDMSL